MICLRSLQKEEYVEHEQSDTHINIRIYRYKKASSTRDAVVELRITFERKQKYMATGIRLFPNEWSRGRVVNRLDSVIINKTLDKFMLDVRNIIYDMLDAGSIDIFAIPAKLKAKQ